MSYTQLRHRPDCAHRNPIYECLPHNLLLLTSIVRLPELLALDLIHIKVVMNIAAFIETWRHVIH